MSESPISLRDETGIERFRGTQSPGGGSQPWVNRNPVGDITIPDGYSLVVAGYYNPSGTLTLQGDAALSIL